MVSVTGRCPGKAASLMKVFSRQRLLLIVMGLALATGGCSWFGGWFKSKPEEDPELKGKVAFKITITARRYSFRPDIIRVKHGNPVGNHAEERRRPPRVRDSAARPVAEFGAFEPADPSAC